MHWKSEVETACTPRVGLEAWGRSGELVSTSHRFSVTCLGTHTPSNSGDQSRLTFYGETRFWLVTFEFGLWGFFDGAETGLL